MNFGPEGTLERQNIEGVKKNFCNAFLVHWSSMMKYGKTRMWANAQRDGRPAKNRWRPLFNAAVWLTTKTRKPLKFAGGAPNSQTDLSH